jgi:hypothetical protein
LQTQYNVRQQDMITVQRLDQGENLKQPGGKVKRAILAVAGTGLLLMAGVTIAFDAFMRRRRRPGNEGMAEFDIDNQPVIANGSRRTLMRDLDNDTVRIAAGADRSVGGSSPVERSPADRAAMERPANSEPGAAPMIPSDETIVLPLPRQWPAEDKGGSRR